MRNDILNTERQRNDFLSIERLLNERAPSAGPVRPAAGSGGDWTRVDLVWFGLAMRLEGHEASYWSQLNATWPPIGQDKNLAKPNPRPHGGPTSGVRAPSWRQSDARACANST